MSAAFNLKTFLLQRLEDTSSTYLKDLALVPADKLGVSPMGAARPPLVFTAECAAFNRFAATLLRGEAPSFPSPEVHQQYFASIDTLEKATEELRESVKELSAALVGLDESELMVEVTVPWGETMPRYNAVEMATVHMSYHDGQINYVQTLYGDTVDHWM